MSAVNRFLVSVPTSARGGMPVGRSNNASREAAALRARETEARRVAAQKELTQKKNEKILLKFCDGWDADGSLHPSELRECLKYLESDVFCSSIINVDLKTKVDEHRAEWIRELTVLIQSVSETKEIQMEKLKKIKKGLKKTSYLPNTFENHVWTEIFNIRELMASFAKSKLQGWRKVDGVSSTVPTLKKEINMSDKAKEKTLLNHDEREDDDDSDSSSDDDQDEDIEFNATREQRRKNLKGLIRDDDHEEKMSVDKSNAFWSAAAGGAAARGAAAGGATNRMSQRKKKLVNWYKPNFENVGSKAAKDFCYNPHVHVLHTRLKQILRLSDYWKKITDSYDLDGLNVSVKLINTNLKTIRDEVNTKFHAYEKKYKKMEELEEKNKSPVILDEDRFGTAEEMDLYWIEYDADGKDEWSLISDRSFIQEVPEFVREEHVREKTETKTKTIDYYVITMRNDDFNSLRLTPIQTRKLHTVFLKRENEKAADYIEIWVKQDSRHWHIQRHIKSEVPEEITSDSSEEDYSRPECDESSADSGDVESHDDEDDKDAEFEEPVELDDEEDEEDDEEKKVRAELKQAQLKAEVRLNEIAMQRALKKARLDAGGS